jgi:hypothetical protein
VIDFNFDYLPAIEQPLPPDLDTLPFFELKKILTEKGIPHAENITKEQALSLLAAFEKPLFQSYAEIMAEVIEIKELIGGIIQAGCTCQLFGPSGDGKTFVAIDFSLSVATGSGWNGLPCRQGLVVYFNGEGRHGFKLRLKAWQKYHGITGRVDFYASKQVITFDDAGLALAVAEIQRIEQVTGMKVSLIVIDTLARHLIGDENSTRDMSDFVRAVDGMRDMFSDSTALVVHHTGNSVEATGRSRGSSALKAALDVEIQCMKGTLTFTKMKDSEVPAPVDFKLQVVRVGAKEDGTPITSCAVVYGEKSAKNCTGESPAKMTKEELAVFMIVRTHPGGIHVDDARAEYVKHKTKFDSEIKLNSVRKTFRDCLESLTLKGKIHIDGNSLIFEGRGLEGTFTAKVPLKEGTSGDYILKDSPQSPLSPFADFVPEVEPELFTKEESPIFDWED